MKLGNRHPRVIFCWTDRIVRVQLYDCDIRPLAVSTAHPVPALMSTWKPTQVRTSAVKKSSLGNRLPGGSQIEKLKDLTRTLRLINRAVWIHFRISRNSLHQLQLVVWLPEYRYPFHSESSDVNRARRTSGFEKLGQTDDLSRAGSAQNFVGSVSCLLCLSP